MSTFDVLTLTLDTLRKLALQLSAGPVEAMRGATAYVEANPPTNPEYPADAVKLAFGFGSLTATAEDVSDAIRRLNGILATAIEALPACEHCDHRDYAEVGDHASMVAACTTCDRLTCGECWDRYHAKTCGDYCTYADYDESENDDDWDEDGDRDGE